MKRREVVRGSNWRRERKGAGKGEWAVNLTHSSFANDAASVWNNLPVTVRSTTSLTLMTFKRHDAISYSLHTAADVLFI